MSERQFLLASLFDYVKQLQAQESGENVVVSARHGMPEVVKEIAHVRQLEARAAEVADVAGKLLDDLQGYEKLSQVVLELVKDLKHQHNELFESWSRDVVSYIRSNTLR